MGGYQDQAIKINDTPYTKNPSPGALKSLSFHNVRKLIWGERVVF